MRSSAGIAEEAKLFKRFPHKKESLEGDREEGGMVTDPVCRMEVDEKKAAATATYKGVIYCFCAVACQKAFEKAPEKYVEEKEG